MNLSHKLTFSLVFFSVLLLAFVSLPIMAHEGTTGNLNHDHPLLEALPATDLNNDEDQTDTGEEAIAVHNEHPRVVSIALKPADNVRGSVAAVIPDDTNTADVNESQFTLVVTFDRDIVNDATSTTIPTFDSADLTFGAQLANDDLATAILLVDKTSAAGSSTLVVNRVEGSNKQYEVVVTPAVLPNADTDDTTLNDNTLMFRIRVAAGEVFSLQTRGLAPRALDAIDVPGGANYVSSVYAFTLVAALPTQLDAPANPVATAGNKEVRLQWDAVTGAAGYQYSSDIDPIWMNIPGDGTTASHTVTGLDNGTPYAFQVRATGIVGDAGMEVSFTAVTPNDAQFIIPANSFLVVVRDADATRPGAGGLKFRADIRTAVWKSMPDLYDLFNRNAPHGGGALVLKDTSGNIDNEDNPVYYSRGSIGISEIMWARDERYFGNQTPLGASQWIELHNLNSTPVNVSLTYLKGTDIAEEANGLRGELSGENIDAITNFFNNRPGKAAWDLKGSNGDSAGAVNFVSMARILPDKKDVYANADGARYDSRDGRNVNHWVASSNTYLAARTSDGKEYKYIGTPGRVNNFKPQSQGDLEQARSFKPAGNTIVINEVGNRTEDKYSWIEIRNASSGEINLRNYLITKVTAVDTETVILRFPADDKIKLAANEVFLILSTDPADDVKHPIAATGHNVDMEAAAQVPGTPNSPVRYKVNAFDLPDNGEVVLMVRKPDGPQNNGPGDNGGQGTSEIGDKADLDKIVDIAGYHSNLSKGTYPNSVSSTKLWPLYNFDAPSFNNNKFEKEKVHQRNRTGSLGNDRAGVGSANNKEDQTAFGDRGWTGIGYRRNVDQIATHGGTPGYPNNAFRSDGTDITSPVYISEIMYADDNRGSLPQWIEIRNPSATLGANLHNWRLTITNHDSMNEEGDLFTGTTIGTVLLNNLEINPNSAVLITSRKGPRFDTNLPDNDIFTLFPNHRTAFNMTNATSDILNPYGFTITLHAKGNDGNQNNWQLVDSVGNLAERRTAIRRENPATERFDAPRWTLPHAFDEDGNRISVARTNMPHGSKTKGFMPADGREASSWILSNLDNRTDLISPTYYGHREDYSTPGQTLGQPLPVELSFFRPTSENGKVTIQWTTESELDNAGFNILRSKTRNGEFTQVNEQMIQGKGTTAERTTYKWVDTTAKPSAVYYYQIEDVSFSGQHTQLAVTKLKGLISAKGKLTTQWGNLKNLR